MRLPSQVRQSFVLFRLFDFVFDFVSSRTSSSSRLHVFVRHHCRSSTSSSRVFLWTY